METLTQLFLSYVTDRQTAEHFALFFIAGAVFFVVFGLLLLANSYFDPVRSRFLKDSNANFTTTADRDNTINVYLKYQRILLPSDEQLIGRTIQRLHHAGFHFRKNLYQYYALRFVLMIALPVAVLVILTMIPKVPLNYFLQAAGLAFVVGFVGPSLVLDRMVKNRQKTIQRAFPDALDLLVVCSEAGLSLDAALQKVTSEISFSQPVLAQELSLVIAEVRAGVDRKKAFNGLAERTGVDDIRGLMSAINQSMRFGSSIAETLRVYSEDFRDKRMQAAEEKAAKIGAKLIFPIAVCLLPCFILIVLVPFALSLTKVFKNM
ncbi:type II secretion system F family protein [Methylomicrobium sp. RS1]|jgi:tight adherence protein C|uniref:type II secretion system F family protein n=1 Tax=Candidatus Methylomicrobium oryzae TaxID=2802053 RepID=UPI001923706D|nr:type II secretion system F family protein [Methylomicrobium sp. RS1]MBL1263667.1 type II secretion system F family protein [Methylomicrobium sp. RS1]